MVFWIGWALLVIGLGLAATGSYVHYYAGVMPGLATAVVGLIILGVYAVIKPKGVKKGE